MSDQDEQKMKAHGITSATRTEYFYKGYKYDRLDDAVRYAEIESARTRKNEKSA